MSLSSGRLTLLSDAFVTSSGTITMDLAQNKMLLIRWNKNGEIFLPKGRKNIGETLEDAAVRETYEETGVRVTLLPLPTPTSATLGPAVKSNQKLNTEPVALSQRTMSDGTLKLIFWFCAAGDSTTAYDLGTQEEGEDFDPIWVDLDSTIQKLTFPDDKVIAERVIQLHRANFTPKIPHLLSASKQ